MNRVFFTVFLLLGPLFRGAMAVDLTSACVTSNQQDLATQQQHPSSFFYIGRFQKPSRWAWLNPTSSPAEVTFQVGVDKSGQNFLSLTADDKTIGDCTKKYYESEQLVGVIFVNRDGAPGNRIVRIFPWKEP
jgi:hypothetical protein